jgi:tripeptide aminopeptidase
MSGTVEETRMDYIIRDHDHAKFEARKAYVQAVAAHLADKYGAERIVLNVRDEYYNMREKIEPVREVVDIAAEAMQHFGITPTTEPIRGGTDGSQLSFKGLPTPNLFTGGENYHGRYEYVSADDMKKSAEVVVEIIKLFAAKA